MTATARNARAPSATVALALAAALGSPSAAWGQAFQSCQEVSPDYRRLMNEAVRVYAGGDNLAEARALFRLAFLACPSTVALEGEIRVASDMGRLDLSYAMLKWIEDVPDASRRRDILAFKAALERRLKQEGYGTLYVRREPADAEVYLDGERISQSAGITMAPVAPGAHELWVFRDGCIARRYRVDVGRGEVVELVASLDPRGGAEAAKEPPP